MNRLRNLDPHAQFWRRWSLVPVTVAAVAVTVFAIAEFGVIERIGVSAQVAERIALWALGFTVAYGMLAVYGGLKARQTQFDSVTEVELPSHFRYVGWVAVALAVVGFAFAIWYTVSRGLVSLR
jgi:hypothetical protein